MSIHTISKLLVFSVMETANICCSVMMIYFLIIGHHLSRLPVEPKLGKMLVFGAIFNCLSPIMTIVARLTSRDPFVTPYDQKDVSSIIFKMHALVSLFSRGCALEIILIKKM